MNCKNTKQKRALNVSDSKSSVFHSVSAAAEEICPVMMSQVCCYLVDGLITGVLQAQVDHGVLQRSAHVELQRQIINPLRTNMQTLLALS